MTDASDTAAVLQRYARAFVEHDPSLLETLIADDCVVERAKPVDGQTHLTGRAACLDNWRKLAANRAGAFTIEEIVAVGERGLVFWHYRFGPGEHDAQRGLNVLVVRDGQIASERGYVKDAP
jgi:ketosteroid isomerase-like protein